MCMATTAVVSCCSLTFLGYKDLRYKAPRRHKVAGSSEQIPGALQREEQRVQPAQHERIRDKQREQCPRHDESADLMRCELQPNRIAPRQENLRKLNDELIIPGKCSDFPPVLRQRTARHAVVCLSFGIEDDALSCKNNVEGSQDVIKEHAFRKLTIKFTPDSVD